MACPPGSREKREANVGWWWRRRRRRRRGGGEPGGGEGPGGGPGRELGPGPGRGAPLEAPASRMEIGIASVELPSKFRLGESQPKPDSVSAQSRAPGHWQCAA
eukprot:1442406-Rhodomonas_salina.1